MSDMFPTAEHWSPLPPRPSRSWWPPTRWPFTYKILSVGVAAAVLAAGGTAAALHTVGSNTEPGVATYLCYEGAAGGEAALLQWRPASDGVLDGTVQAAHIIGTAPSEEVVTVSGRVAGQIDGDMVTVDLGSGQWYGKLTGGTLIVNVPQSDGTIQPVTCRQSTVTGWNAAVAALNRKADIDNAAANAQAQRQQQQENINQAQQALTRDVVQLAQDAATLNTDKSLASAVNQMKTDYATEQADWRTEQSDTCAGVSGDAGTVSGDASTVSGDLSTLRGAINTLQAGDIAAVQNDLSTVQKDIQTLRALGATPTTDSSAAVNAGNQALTNAANAIAWANQQGNSINGQAQQLATQADNYATSHGC